MVLTCGKYRTLFNLMNPDPLSRPGLCGSGNFAGGIFQSADFKASQRVLGVAFRIYIIRTLSSAFATLPCFKRPRLKVKIYSFFFKRGRLPRRPAGLKRSLVFCIFFKRGRLKQMLEIGGYKTIKQNFIYQSTNEVLK
jgi:hypothetical protein